MSPRHRTIVDGVTQSSRAQPPLRPRAAQARRGDPSGGSRNAGTHPRTHPRRPPRTHARDRVRAYQVVYSVGAGYGGRREAGTGGATRGRRAQQTNANRTAMRRRHVRRPTHDVVCVWLTSSMNHSFLPSLVPRGPRGGGSLRGRSVITYKTGLNPTLWNKHMMGTRMRLVKRVDA